MEIRRDEAGLFSVIMDHNNLETPFFVPAISSIKSNFELEESLELIDSTGYPGYLVSAYDLYHAGGQRRTSLLDAISKSTAEKAITFLDSGYYEAFWYRDSDWSFDHFESVLGKVDVDFSFSFDVFWDKGKPLDKHLKESITTIAKTAGVQRIGTTIPLLHSEAAHFPEVAKRIVENIGPEVIGVPERELGSSIFERAKTVRLLRTALDETGRRILLHLLGTGNPVSILVYSLCGADTFDGQEWSQTVVDPGSAHLFHFIQKDLIDCSCSACSIRDIAYHLQTMSHNLVFYRDFTKQIREAIRNAQAGRLLEKYLDHKSAEVVLRIIESS